QSGVAAGEREGELGGGALQALPLGHGGLGGVALTGVGVAQSLDVPGARGGGCGVVGGFVVADDHGLFLPGALVVPVGAHAGPSVAVGGGKAVAVSAGAGDGDGQQRLAARGEASA